MGIGHHFNPYFDNLVDFFYNSRKKNIGIKCLLLSHLFCILGSQINDFLRNWMVWEISLLCSLTDSLVELSGIVVCQSASLGESAIPPFVLFWRQVITITNDVYDSCIYIKWQDFLLSSIWCRGFSKTRNGPVNTIYAW